MCDVDLCGFTVMRNYINGDCVKNNSLQWCLITGFVKSVYSCMCVESVGEKGVFQRGRATNLLLGDPSFFCPLSQTTA